VLVLIEKGMDAKAEQTKEFDAGEWCRQQAREDRTIKWRLSVQKYKWEQAHKTAIRDAC
jgi:hypothetical protein